MKPLRLINLISCGAALLVLMAGCSNPKATFDPRATGTAKIEFEDLNLAEDLGREWLEQGETLFSLGPGDVLDVEILGTGNTRSTVVVGPDGRIYFHLLPGMDVWGLTLEQTKDLLQRELARFLTGPQVSISLRAVGKIGRASCRERV